MVQYYWPLKRKTAGFSTKSCRLCDFLFTQPAVAGSRFLSACIINGAASDVTASSFTTTSSTLSIPGRSNIVSSRISSKIERSPRAPVLRSIARLAMAASASGGEGQSHVFQLEQPLILFDQRILRLCQNDHQRVLIQIRQGRDNWQTAHKFRDQSEFQQIFRLQTR